MKQFDLQEYLKNPDKKIITRDGRSARIICTDAKRDFPLIALIEKDDSELPVSYTPRGTTYEWRESDCDLFFAPEKKEGWINIYRHKGQNSTLSKSIYDTKEEALRYRFKHYADTVKIEWEE